MTIVEALKAGLIPRLSCSNRFLYWADGAEHGEEQNHWVVGELKRGSGSAVLIVTQDESRAVEVLIGEIKG